MNSKELQMYRLMGAIYAADVPIIFKGAMVTNSILKNAGINIIRETKDIDGSWTGNKITAQEIAIVIEESIRKQGMNVSVEAFREHDEKKSAGFFVKDGHTGTIITKMDMDLRTVPDVDFYQLGDIAFYGFTPNQIICDKTVVVSSDKVFRRSKDIVDLYSLSKCVSFSADDIYRMAEKTDRQIGNFDAFLNRKNELEHAYNKLNGVIGKPDFEDLYDDLNCLMEPFITKSTSNKKWDSLKKEWKTKSDETKQIRRRKLDIEL